MLTESLLAFKTTSRHVDSIRNLSRLPPGMSDSIRNTSRLPGGMFCNQYLFQVENKLIIILSRMNHGHRFMEEADVILFILSSVTY